MFIIDLFLFVILIASIIAFSPVGKILAEYFLGVSDSQNFLELNKKYIELEKRLKEHEEEIKKLREGFIMQDEKVHKLQVYKKSDIDNKSL